MRPYNILKLLDNIKIDYKHKGGASYPSKLEELLILDTNLITQVIDECFYKMIKVKKAISTYN